NYLCIPLRCLTITSTQQTMVAKAQGDKVTLPCMFTFTAADDGPLDIEWVLIPTDNQKNDQTVRRVRFSNPDPKSGDGSMEILDLKSTDSGTYQCRVKKPPGVESQKIQLTVLVKPGRTKCYVEGSQVIGHDLTLKCGSQEGSATISYTWRKSAGTEELPATALLNTGDLAVKNASQDHSGIYTCIASNRVGEDECFLVLKVTPPKNTAGIIAGAIIGTLLGLICLAFLVFCCCKKRREKKYEKEVHHDIREDVPPPKSRTSTAHSYIGSNRSSLGSMSPSNMEGYAKNQYNKVPSEDFERTSSQNQNFP
uniref:CXADR Ig-like cell adhesion molecule n=1 Tax=Sphenodon punctatus TaxID=8508 RepID=A0A8D0H5R0_SPHPU